MEFNQDTLDRLNDNFRIFFLFDFYFLENYSKLFRIANRINDLIKDFELFIPRDDISLDALVKLESDFLFSLKPEYMHKFKEDYRIGHIIRMNDNAYRRFPLFNDYNVCFSEENNIESLLILSHEYIHRLASLFPEKKEDTSAYWSYTEMLSLLGELKCLDFLKNYLHDTEKINLYKKWCIVDRRPKFNDFLFVEPLFEIFFSGENFEKQQIEKLLEVNPYYKSLGKEIVLKKLRHISESKIEDLEEKLLDYRYILGLANAAYLHQNDISNEEFVNLIEKINTVEVNEFEKLFPIAKEDELILATQKEYCYKK